MTAGTMSLAAELSKWTPLQFATLAELVNLASDIHEKSKTEAQILRAIKRRTNAIKKRSAK